MCFIMAYMPSNFALEISINPLIFIDYENE